MSRYICIKGFQLPYFDENMHATDEYAEIVKDSLWDISDEVGESDIKLNKIGGFSDFDCIHISNNTFNTNFVLVS